MTRRPRNRSGIFLKVSIIAFAALGVFATGEQTAAAVTIQPDMGQSRQQQIADERECHDLAVKESGYDPGKDDAVKSHASDNNRIIRNPVIRSAARGMATGGPTGAAAGAFLARKKQQRKAMNNSESTASDPMYALRQRYAGSVFTCLTKKGYTIEDTGGE